MPDPHDEHVRIARQRGEPFILTLDGPLTQRAVQQMRDLTRGVPPTRPVIIDVTTISGFDSDGTTELQALQDELGTSRVLVVGFRQAAARLLALVADLADPPISDDSAATSRLLPTPGMLFVEIKSGASASALDSALKSAIARDIAIVVVDLAAVTIPSIVVLDAIRSASRAAASRGHELVLVNVTQELALLLDRVGLAVTTYLAASR